MAARRTGPPRTVSVEALAAGDHACLGFDTAEDRWAVRAAFAAAGLARGERVLFVTGARLRGGRDRALELLAAHGLGARQAAHDGRLEIVAEDPGYDPALGFDAAARTDYWTAATDDALARGFSGLRAAGDMAWAAGPGVDGGALTAYESGLTPLYAKLGFTGLCEYDRRVFAAGPHLLDRLLAAHPLAVAPVPGRLYARREGGTLLLAGDADLATRNEFELSVRQAAREPDLAVIDLTGLAFLDAYCARAALRAAADKAAGTGGAADTGRAAVAAAGAACAGGNAVVIACTPAQYRLLRMCGGDGTDGVMLRVG